MPACWERRGCDEIMQETCPHAVQSGYSPCPMDCLYTNCDKPQHEDAVDFELLLDPTVDRSAAVKSACCTCAFFLRRAPRLAGGA